MGRCLRLITSAALACTLATTLAVAIVGAQAFAPDESGAIPQAQAASAKAKNAKAHAAYKKKLAKIQNENGIPGVSYRFIDITGDKVDEMVVAWWPAVYTYKSGKVKRVFSGSRGGLGLGPVYKAKKVFMVNSSGALTYFKWNGKKFKPMVTVCDLNTQTGDGSYYWIKGKGDVSESAAKTYVKKLIGSSKATKLKFKKNY